MSDLLALDAEIAERIMGRAVTRDAYVYDPAGGGAGFTGPGFTDTFLPATGSMEMIPRYSTSGDAMLEVLARMKALGWKPYLSEPSDGTHLATFVRSASIIQEDEVVKATAPTLPEAVARAALKAVGE